MYRAFTASAFCWMAAFFSANCLSYPTDCFSFVARAGSGLSGSTSFSTASFRSLGRLCRCSLISVGRSGGAGGLHPKRFTLGLEGQWQSAPLVLDCLSGGMSFTFLAFLCLCPPCRPGRRLEECLPVGAVWPLGSNLWEIPTGPLGLPALRLEISQTLSLPWSAAVLAGRPLCLRSLSCQVQL